ncbi:MAG: response regulator, partial [Acidobacteria bacterium]
RRHAEEERRQLHENLAQSDRLASMGMMAAGLAHEINNPLAYALYNLESLCEDLPRYVRQLAVVQQTLVKRLGESGLRETLGGHVDALQAGVWLDVEARFSDALQGTRRIKDIARRLGTFSRIEKDQAASVELPYPIDSAIEIASNEIKYRATIVREIGPTAPVMGSEGRLSQVFLNLLLNAAQAIEEGAPERNTIRVRTWQEGATVLAEVQDTGSGIPPENLERIFDPFFTTKPVGVGSGLGLSIVRTILAGYHGTIEVESELGRGTRFLIRLPAAPVEATTREPAHVDTRVDMATDHRGRLLVIDDDAGVRKALRRILDSHELIEAESGRQACELVATDEAFDVILCDIGMPNMSGIDVHSWLLEHHPRLAQRVVFLTGGAFTPRARAYLEKVQNPQVEKPFDTANLEKLVTDYVRRRDRK